MQLFLSHHNSVYLKRFRLDGGGKWLKSMSTQACVRACTSDGYIRIVSCFNIGENVKRLSVFLCVPL